LSHSDAIEIFQLHSALHKCIKLFCQTPSFASWPGCQDVLVICVSTFTHHYPSIHTRSESKAIFHLSASCLDYVSSSSGENVLLMCAVPAPTNFDALSCCFRAICSGVIQSLAGSSAQALDIASFCSGLSQSFCASDTSLILSSMSYCCNVAVFFGSEITVFVPQLLYHYIPLILIPSRELSVVASCCKLLLTLSPLINAEAFDLDCGLVEVLLFKMLHMDKSSPLLALLAQALLQLCCNHSKLLSVCLRYIPDPIISLHVNQTPDGIDDTTTVTVASSTTFCGHFFEDTLAPDCIWTENCRKELLGAMFQRGVFLPSMLSSVSDDSVIRPVIALSQEKFTSVAQKKYTSVHGVYLELFVSQGKWFFRDTKALLEELFVQLTKLYHDSDSPKSPASCRSVAAAEAVLCFILTSLQCFNCVELVRARSASSSQLA
jgi:hypothetical protein